MKNVLKTLIFLIVSFLTYQCTPTEESTPAPQTAKIGTLSKTSYIEGDTLIIPLIDQDKFPVNILKIDDEIASKPLFDDNSVKYRLIGLSEGTHTVEIKQTNISAGKVDITFKPAEFVKTTSEIIRFQGDIIQRTGGGSKLINFAIDDFKVIIKNFNGTTDDFRLVDILENGDLRTLSDPYKMDNDTVFFFDPATKYEVLPEISTQLGIEFFKNRVSPIPNYEPVFEYQFSNAFAYPKQNFCVNHTFVAPDFITVDGKKLPSISNFLRGGITPDNRFARFSCFTLPDDITLGEYDIFLENNNGLKFYTETTRKLKVVEPTYCFEKSNQSKTEGIEFLVFDYVDGLDLAINQIELLQLVEQQSGIAYDMEIDKYEFPSPDERIIRVILKPNDQIAPNTTYTLKYRFKRSPVETLKAKSDCLNSAVFIQE